MRRKLIIGLVLLNALLAGAIATTSGVTQIIPRGLWDCCEIDEAFEPYCCSHCCWLRA